MDFIFMHKVYKPFPKDAVYQISEYLKHQFFKIHKMLPPFPPYWTPTGASPLIFELEFFFPTNLNSLYQWMLPTNFGHVS